MNIDKALSHLKWKFQNTWKPTAKDIEAYNAIVDYKDNQDNITICQNESLAKLWIHQIILLSNTKLYNGERSIQVIDEILEEDLHSWCIKLKNDIPMMRFKAIGLNEHPLNDIYSITEQKERNEAIVNEFETELTESMKYEISEENIIKFVSSQINRIINKFEK